MKAVFGCFAAFAVPCVHSEASHLVLLQRHAEARISSREPFELGHEVVERGAEDGYEGMQFVDTGKCFSTDGFVKSVQFYPGRAGGGKFKIYKPVGEASYTLRSETLRIEVPEADKVMDYEFPEVLNFKAGDCIGWSHYGKGTMAYTDGQETGEGSDVWWVRSEDPDDMEQVGSTIVFTDHGLRAYSYTVRYQEEGRVKPYGACNADRQTGGASGDETCVTSKSSSPISCTAGKCVGTAKKNDNCRSGKYSGLNHKGEYVCKSGLVCRGYVDGTKWGACGN